MTLLWQWSKFGRSNGTPAGAEWMTLLRQWTKLAFNLLLNIQTILDGVKEVLRERSR